MGNQRLNRNLFFSAHPSCCFCGGKEKATEIDHIPARHLFRDRQWPQGYEFPACSNCNRASSLDELAMGALVRIQITNYSPHDEREMQEAFRKLNNRRPEWMQQFRAYSRNETRRALKNRGLTASAFPGGEVYMADMPVEIVEASHRYAEKLGRALYYKATGRIIPPEGGVRASALSNVQWMSPDFPIDGFKKLAVQPALTRSGQDLSDQFAYRYGVATDGAAVAFLIQFRESVGMFVLAFESTAEYELVKAKRLATNAAA